MLGLFKVAVDNFMNIRLEALQKWGGPRYDAQHAGTVSLISTVDGTDAQTRSMLAGQRFLMWMSLRDYQTYSTHIIISSCLYKKKRVSSF